MAFLLRISRIIDRITAFLGRAVSWLILVAVLVSAANATSRKMLSVSSNSWLELQWYLFGFAYLIAASYTLQRNEHIRIDIVSNLLPQRVRDVIDLFGHFIMLLPIAFLLVIEMWPSMMRSYWLGEVSTNFGGLTIWPAKAAIVLGFSLLIVQAVSEIIKRVAVMRGIIPDPHPRSGHVSPATEGGA